jgi:hypothetical protein
VNSLQEAPKKRIPYAIAIAVLAACLLFLRGIPRLRFAAFFAQDGDAEFAQAHNDGLAALLEPYAGYQNLIPRVVAAVLAPFPITAMPALYAVAAFLVHVVMLTPALSARLDWVIRGQVLRAVLFALLCVLPPEWEIIGNIVNLIWVGGISLVLLMLSDDPRTGAGRVCELAALLALGLSGLLIVFIAPWFVWRWRRTRSRHSLAVVVVAVVVALVQGVSVLVSDRTTPGGSLIALPAVWIERIGASWLFGDYEILDSPWRLVLLLAAFAWCVGAVVITIVALRRTAVALWLLHFTLLAVSVLAYGYMPPPFSWQRYFLVPMAIVVVLLVAVISARRWAIAAAGWLAVGVGAMVHDFAPEPYPYRPDLTGLQQCVKRGEPVCRQAIFSDVHSPSRWSPTLSWTIELRQ